MITIDEEDNIIGRTKCLSDWRIIKKTLKYRSPVLHVWMTYKFIYEELGGYREISGVEDYDFLLRMTSAGYKYTNIDEYLYYVRLRRHNNTVFTLGPGQLKLHSYAYRLYKEKIKMGTDSFNENQYKKNLQVNNFFMLLHNLSSKALLKAIALKNEKKIIRMLFYIIFSCISPYQVSYLISRIKYTIIVGVS
jgi:hypothetical protein